MRVRAIGRVKWVMSASCLVAAAGWVQANGFRNPPEGAAALSMTGSKTAMRDDASAVSHNPANLVNLEANQFHSSFTLIHADVDYTGVSGSGSTEEPWKMLPNFFYAAPIPDLDISAGIGMTTPYGQSTEWEKDGPFAFTAPYFAELRTVNIRPVLAYQVNPRLSVAIGPDFLYSDLNFKQLFPWSAVTGNPAEAPGDMRLEGDGLGVGGTAALAWKPMDGHRVGLTYRSQVKVEYDGNLHVSNLPPPGSLPGPLGQILVPASDLDTEITFPSIISLGYGYEVCEDWRVGVDLEWVEFSTFDELPLDAGRNAPLLVSDTLPQNWDDTWVLALGVAYDASETLVVRGGYTYLESPVPEETLAPTLPDVDRHLLTIGLGAQLGHHDLDVAYAYSIYDDLNVQNNLNPLYNGEYDINTHLITLTYAYRF